MRSAQVAPHFRCNQACAFCEARRPQDALPFIQAPAVRSRIDAALATGAEEIVLSGGEPTLRADLPALIAHARSAGARRVTLETNGTLLDEARAAALRAAGLDLARVHLSGWGPALDLITRDEGGFEAASRGVDALLAAGCPVEIQATLVRSTRELLPALPAQLVARFGQKIEGLVVVVPGRSPAPDELLPYEQVAASLGQLDQASRAAGVLLRLHPSEGPPPCIFPARERPQHLYALSPGGARDPERRKVAGCASCRVDDRCGGFARSYLDRFGPPAHWPIADDRGRRRLSMVGSVREQIERELVSPTLTRIDGAQIIEETIRINFQCNQACHFCFVSTHLPHPPDDAVRRAIEGAARRGAKIILSGGEPTLNARLPEYLRLATGLSSLPVQLQTNAVRLSDRELCTRLREAGLTETFVSLHGSHAAVSDAITQAPGTFARTLQGVENLLAEGVGVMLNFVICATNVADLVPFVELATTRFPAAELTFSFVAPSSDLVPADAASLPRYSGAIPALVAAITLAESRGVPVRGLDSMCGLPVCLLPPWLVERLAPNEIPPGFDEGEFLKTETCRRCSLERRCFGIRRRYAAAHGVDELRAID